MTRAKKTTKTKAKTKTTRAKAAPARRSKTNAAKKKVVAKAPAKKAKVAKAKVGKAPASKKPAARVKAAKVTVPAPAPAKKTARKTVATPKRGARAPKLAAGGKSPVGTSAADSGSPLGTKYTCFECEAKFYDLNKPEPLCPKCGVDQRQKPKAPARPSSTGRRRRRSKRGAMAPLLDDDDDEVVVVEEDEMESGLEGRLLEKRGTDSEEESDES